MSISNQTWRAIAIGATAVALFSLSPYSLSQRNGQGQGPGGSKLDDIIARLGRIEQVVGCPVDQFVDPESGCEHNPAGTSVSFCIAQGRGLDISGAWGAALKGSGEVGARWDVGPLGDVKGQLEFPLALAGLVPLPTEAKIGGAAGIGRNLNVCIDVPLGAAEEDQARLADLVRGMNAEPNIGMFDRTKFQRRLLRLIRYAERRTPAPDTASATGAVSTQTRNEDPNELDRIDEAVDRFMSGDFRPMPGEPFGILKDQIVRDLTASLDVPSPVQSFLDDPDAAFARLPALGSPVGCDTFGLDGSISQRFQNVATTCARLDDLPSFETTTTAFDTVHRIDGLLADLPDEIIFGVGDILPDPQEANLPTPRPDGYRFCNVFPRLCR